MQIILTKDVPKVGQAGEIKEVANGFARNKLLPQGLAEPATPERVAVAEAEQAHRTEAKKGQEEALAQSIEKLAGTQITIKEKANEKGNLFSSIHADKIIDAVKAQAGVEILPSAFVSFKPIKEVGEHEVKIAGGEKEEVFTIAVEAA